MVRHNILFDLCICAFVIENNFSTNKKIECFYKCPVSLLIHHHVTLNEGNFKESAVPSNSFFPFLKIIQKMPSLRRTPISKESLCLSVVKQSSLSCDPESKPA